MVFPIRDSVTTRRQPWMTNTLVLINVLFFLAEVGLGRHARALIELLAIVPVQALDPSYWALTLGWPLATLFTSTLLHGSWSHLIGNMIYLWVFGDNIEDLLGRWRFLAFYILCGIFAGVAHILAYPTSDMPTIGASGAVSGVLGAYILSFPRARVLTLVPIGLIVPAVRVPAWAYLSLWFLAQLASGLAPIWVREMTQAIAFWAHIAGFLGGIALVRLLAPPGGERLEQR